MRKRKDWDWHEHGPPWGQEEGQGEEDSRHLPPCWDSLHWQGWEDREHGPPMPPWQKDRCAGRRRRHSDRFLFARFALIFGLFVLLACGALGAFGAIAVLFLRDRPLPYVPPEYVPPEIGTHPLRWVLALLAVAFLFILLLRRVGIHASRRYTAPLSETMKAADALAAGDLSARVPVEGSGEFRHFARSFNRMAAALETADRQRRELLADVAHELRTPLTIVQGNLEGLRDGVYEATSEHMDLVLDETRKLGRLVDDLRILTLAEAGQLPLDLQVLDVPQLLADVRDVFAFQAAEAGIDLSVDAAGSLPSLVADPQRLGQVLGNLLSNALRHTPPGGEVTIGAAPLAGDAAPGGVRLWVADTGEGIPAEDLSRIFDRFWRGDPARSHKAGAGSGLGLAIARSLVEAHGGHVGVESRVGQGTVVWCVLPCS